MFDEHDCPHRAVIAVPLFGTGVLDAEAIFRIAFEVVESRFWSICTWTTVFMGLQVVQLNYDAKLTCRRPRPAASSSQPFLVLICRIERSYFAFFLEYFGELFLGGTTDKGRAMPLSLSADQ